MKKAKERGRLRRESVIRSCLKMSVLLCALGSEFLGKNMILFCLSKVRAQETHVKVKVSEKCLHPPGEVLLATWSICMQRKSAEIIYLSLECSTSYIQLFKTI